MEDASSSLRGITSTCIMTDAQRLKRINELVAALARLRAGMEEKDVE